ncbi:MAG: YwaF family protein [Clostridia bacterium]|nr:YwaF family protein [Clostridia bacterium]
MRDLFFKLFEMSHFNTGIKILPFSVAHIVYILLIAGAIVGLYFGYRNKNDEKKDKLLGILSYAITISYLSDFFVHEFVYGGLNMDKLPFHICTVLCPIVAFTQFNAKFKKFLEPVTMLAIVAPLMYLCYPASVGDGEPWCYQAVQTMFYHGTLLAWGILNIALGKVKPNIKKSYYALILLVVLTLWAKLGNILLEHNWFFLNEDAFYIGLVEGGIIPKWSLMIINPIAFFLVVLAVYGIYYGVCAIITKVKKA